MSPRREAGTCLLLLTALLTSCRGTRPPIRALQTQLQQRLAGFHGEVGVYVRDLTTGDEVAIDADRVLPTASMIKVPILAALCDRVARGDLDYHQTLTYGKDRLYAGEDLLGSFMDGERVALSKVVMLMITTSDNTAALWCQELAGTGTAINAWLESLPLRHTRVNARTPGREDAQRQLGWGQTTPREMAELLVLIRDRRLVSTAASEEMARCLARIYWDGEALSQVPPDVQVLSKQGAVSQSRSEVALVHAPHGDYVFCVITDDQQDRSWRPDNEGFVLLRDVSAMLWRHFEADAPYAPPAGSDKF